MHQPLSEILQNRQDKIHVRTEQVLQGLMVTASKLPMLETGFNDQMKDDLAMLCEVFAWPLELICLSVHWIKRT